MNHRTFLEYFQRPQSLDRIGYQEIKDLVIQYPYCTLLKLMLYDKARAEGREEQSKIAESLSTYLSDRTYLKTRLDKPLDQEVQDLRLSSTTEIKTAPPPLTHQRPASTRNSDEKSVNLKDGKDLDGQGGGQPGFKKPGSSGSQPHGGNLSSSFPQSGQQEPVTPELIEEPSLESLLKEHYRPDEKYNLSKSEDITYTPKSLTEKIWGKDKQEQEKDINRIQADMDGPKKPSESNRSDALKTTNESSEPMRVSRVLSFDALKEGESGKQEKEEFGPSPKEKFSSWKNLNEAEKRVTTLNEMASEEPNNPAAKAKKKKKKDKKPGPRKKAKLFAKQSLKMKDEIISETLAAIHAEQGNHEIAIAMYRQLALLFPEKSAFFAQRIEDLQHKLD